jgi:uncharacterized protein YjdB
VLLAAVKVKAAQKSVVLVKGKKIKLATYAYNALGGKLALTWSSSKKKVAKVSATGAIKAKKVGKAVITAKAANGRKAKIKVKVVAAKPVAQVKKVSAKGIAKTMKVGQVSYAVPKYKPASVSAVKVKFSSSDPVVVQVDKAGRIEAKAKGTVIVTVKAKKKSKKYTVTVG